MSDNKYKVEIFNFQNGEVVKTIGEKLSYYQAEHREMAGLSRVDTNNYGVRIVNENTGEIE